MFVIELGSKKLFGIIANAMQVIELFFLRFFFVVVVISLNSLSPYRQRFVTYTHNFDKIPRQILVK